MPLKPININPDQFVSEQEQSNEPGVIGKIGQAALGLGVRAGQGLTGLTDFPLDILTSGVEHGYNALASRYGIPTTEQFSESHKQRTGLDPRERPQNASGAIESLFDNKSIEPENFLTQTLQKSARGLPLALMTGGLSSPTAIGGDLASSAGMSIAENLGLGPIGEIVFGGLAKGGFGKVMNSLKKGADNPSKIKSFISSLYDEEPRLGNKIKADPKDIRSAIDKVEKRVKRSYIDPRLFSAADKKLVLDNIETSKKALNKKGLTASDLFKEKQRFNEIWKPSSSIQGKYGNEVRGLFVKELNKIAEQNPKWGNVFKQADELYGIQHWQNNVSTFFDDFSKSGKFGSLASNPLLHSTISLLGGALGGPKAAAVAGGGLALKAGSKGFDKLVRAGKFVNSLRKKSEGRKLIQDIAVDAARGSYEEFPKLFTKLGHKAEQYQKNNPIPGLHVSKQLNKDDYEFTG